MNKTPKKGRGTASFQAGANVPPERNLHASMSIPPPPPPHKKLFVHLAIYNSHMMISLGYIWAVVS